MSGFISIVFLLLFNHVFCSSATEFDNVQNSIFNNENRVTRVKRQQRPDPADQFFDNVFQIPISTLNAVNELIKSTRPVIRRARQRIQQQYQAWQQYQTNNNSRPRPNRRSK